MQIRSKTLRVKSYLQIILWDGYSRSISPCLGMNIDHPFTHLLGKQPTPDNFTHMQEIVSPQSTIVSSQSRESESQFDQRSESSDCH